MINLHPYLGTSGSVQAIANRAKERGIPLLIRTKRPPKNGITVNWGIRKNALVAPDVGLNPLFITSEMTDKRRFFERVGRDSRIVPPWTRDAGEAEQWGFPVVARFKTAASGGDGIVLWDQEAPGVPEFPAGAPLYTRYIKKSHEYRCHVFKRIDGVFECRRLQRKAARRGPNGELEVTNWKIRNLENGFVYVMNDGHVPSPVVEAAVLQIMTDHFQDMDFCALDVIYNQHEDRAYVLEGNTAPGLDGSNVDMYLDYFLERSVAA